MSSNWGVFAVIFSIIGCCCLFSIFVAKALSRNLNHVWKSVRFLVAWLVPTLLLVTGILTMHFIERWEYERQVAAGLIQDEGYMGIGVILVYGFPLFVINIIVNGLVAYRATK